MCLHACFIALSCATIHPPIYNGVRGRGHSVGTVTSAHSQKANTTSKLSLAQPAPVGKVCVSLAPAGAAAACKLDLEDPVVGGRDTR